MHTVGRATSSGKRSTLTECGTIAAVAANQRARDLAQCRMVELLSSPEAWLSLATLTALEIVLGVDNIIFIAILSGRLPVAQRERARKLEPCAAACRTSAQSGLARVAYRQDFLLNFANVSSIVLSSAASRSLLVVVNVSRRAYPTGTTRPLANEIR